MLLNRFFTVLLAACAGVASASTLPAQPVQKRPGGPSARVVSSCTKPNTVALTFDDGPYIYLSEVVETLVAANVTGTFFFNGNNYDCIYDPDSVMRVQYAYSKGHQIGSHTWSHKDLTTLTWDQIHDEMRRVDQALQKIIGVTPAFMRPPYGNYNTLVQQASYIRKQVLAMWDFDSEDSVGATPAQSEASYDAIIKQHPSTILALNHETIETTVHQVLPYAIMKLQAAGYKLVSLAECTGLPAYHSVGSPGVRDSTWTC